MPKVMLKNQGQEDEQSKEEIARTIHFHLLGMMKEDLGKATDETIALRRALLLLITVAGDKVDEVGSCLIDYLLTDFSPLAGKFNKDRHDFYGQYSVERTREKNGMHVHLALPKEFAWELFTHVPGLEHPGRKKTGGVSSIRPKPPHIHSTG